MMDAVHRYEGTVNQVLGDGIMALFGAPMAHEDHAVRACYAALAMQAAMRRYAEEVRRTHGLELQIRVGLNSGEVVVRAIGNDLHMDYSAVGQTTHLAARMEQLATPGTHPADGRDPAAGRRAWCRSPPWGRCRSRGWPSRWRSLSWSGPVPSGGACRRLRRGGSRRFVGRQHGAGRPCTRPWRRPERGTARWWRWSARPGWASRAWSTSSSTPTAPRAGWCWRAPRCPTARPRPTSRSSTCSSATVHVEDRDDTRTIRAKVTGQVLTLDEALQDTLPALLALLDALPEDSPFLHARSAAAPPAHARGAQARAAARKPGAAAAPGL